MTRVAGRRKHTIRSIPAKPSWVRFKCDLEQRPKCARSHLGKPPIRGCATRPPVLAPIGHPWGRGGNGMVKGRILAATWAANLSRDSPPPALKPCLA